jgi:hypothetical protein
VYNRRNSQHHFQLLNHLFNRHSNRPVIPL